MKANKQLPFILQTSIIFYFLLESFFNVLVDTNAYIFMNMSNLSVILPGIVIVIIFIIAEMVIFMIESKLKSYKLSILTFLIIILRIGAQFIVSPLFLFVFNFVLFFTTLIWNIEEILMIEKYETEANMNLYFTGILIGLGIQFFVFFLNLSSNISWSMVKIVPTILFCVCLGTITYYFFFPDKIRDLSFNNSQKCNEETRPNISYLHFVIIGALFLLSTIWIINPMAISAYDIINLNLNGLYNQISIAWPSYGYTYYIFIILATAFISYFFLSKRLSSTSHRRYKLIILILVGISLIFNLLTLIIIEDDSTLLSTIYLTLLSISNTLSLVFYFTYLFHFYCFKSRVKLFIGLIIFFITVLFFIILQIEILWYNYVSLLVNVIILSVASSVLIYLLEIKNIRISLKIRESSFSKKNIVALFLLIILLNGIIFVFNSQSRKIRAPVDDGPKVMIWNIHNAIGFDDIFDLDRVVSDIKQNDPDIIGLNEVDLGALKTSFVDIPSYLAHKLGMYYFYGYTFYKHYGNLLLSKYPILKAEIIKLPLIISDAEPRALIKASIEINSQNWTFFITHLSTKREDRLIQVPFIVNEINNLESYEDVVWLGDFNLEPASEAYSSINETAAINFMDTYDILNTDPGYTGHFDDSGNPQKRIDYIMCSPDLSPFNSDVFCSLASDHCAVITNF